MFDIDYRGNIDTILRVLSGKLIQADILYSDDMSSIVNNGGIDLLIPSNLIMPFGQYPPPHDVTFDSIKILSSFTNFNAELRIGGYNPSNGELMGSDLATTISSSDINILSELKDFRINHVRIVPLETIPPDTKISVFIKISFRDSIQPIGG